MALQDDEIRKYAYRVLIDSYPNLMSETQIADVIRAEYEKPVTKCMVHNALSGFAKSNEHFSVHKSMYSVNKLDPPFAPEIPKIHPITRLIVTDLPINPEKI